MSAAANALPHRRVSERSVPGARPGRADHPDGDPLPPGRRTIALCRCGKSMRKPFCDGTHKMIDFVTEPEPRSNID
ncbi:CDGSH iron-sulfur domain-containing protein [Curtobacterium sp. MCPF17_002]|uniref:CDGSH iron-sulfur domain-containing protein n=1 Tax=Curtobacterium sp. MCPF17_002 TaxID=2175645 RepID=UPI0021ABC067|nr:CDGSH iron-sulfur domain-containing protein [Curtobacterium sp. MCPF17_002]WIB77967.1 CDGSH iron-sulfur domain-containing protein [Curtobacterium sp. MCPF17_002]